MLEGLLFSLFVFVSFAYNLAFSERVERTRIFSVKVARRVESSRVSLRDYAKIESFAIQTFEKLHRERFARCILETKLSRWQLDRYGSLVREMLNNVER